MLSKNWQKIKNLSIYEWLHFYFLSLAAFAFTRLFLFIRELLRGNINAVNAPISLVSQSFLIGIRFDLTVTGYITLIPILLTSAHYLISPLSPLSVKIRKTGIIFSFILLAMAIFVNFADLEYWNFSSQRLNTGVFQWMDTPLLSLTMASEIIPLWKEIFFYLIFIFCIWLVLAKKILPSIKILTKNTDQGSPRIIGIKNRIFTYLIFFILVFLTIRGRIEPKSPLRTGHAFFSNNNFANQLALNSVFSLGSSFENFRKRKSVKLTKNKLIESFKDVRKFLLLNKGSKPELSIERFQKSSFPQINDEKSNVILIIAESFTAQGIRAIGAKSEFDLSPLVSKIISKSLTFSNFYANNVHTGHGLFNIISSFPNPPGVSLTKTSIGERQRTTWPKILVNNGYRTIFFVPHDPHFDNMNGYLRTAGFEEIISEADYKAKKVSTLGVFDHEMFQESLKYLLNFHSQKKPFLAVYLTSSNHGPWLVPRPLPFKSAPDGFAKIKKNSYKYTDWAIGNFFQAMQKTAFYKNTIFIITADHGGIIFKSIPQVGIPYPYIHIPLIIHSANHTRLSSGQIITRPGSQIDIGATILDLLGINFNNPFLGQSLFLKTKAKRFVPFIFHDTIGLLLDNYFYIFNPNQSNSIQAMPDYHIPSKVMERKKSNEIIKIKSQVSNIYQVTEYLLEQ